MNIKEARKMFGFEKCDFGCYDDKCSCGREQNRYNAESYLRTSYEYDEGVYACNWCVKEIAKAHKRGELVVL